MVCEWLEEAWTPSAKTVLVLVNFVVLFEILRHDLNNYYLQDLNNVED